MAGPTGTFQADFASFYDACQKAEVSLKGFEQGGATVQDRMNRVSDSLSGVKIVQQATIAAQAVEKIGGVSMLTEKELARVGAIATEAAAKLTAMGQTVPPGIQKIADAANDATKAHSDLGTTVRGLAGDFLAMFTARAAFNFVKSTVDEASALNDLSQQTHMSVEEIQRLAGAMSEFGVDQDTLAKGLFKLSRGIAGGDESVTSGLHLMGMTLKDVEGLNGRELFLKIEAGLATLQGGLRDTAAADLFGGKLGMAMAGASAGIVDALAKWERHNTVVGKDAVEAEDAFGESIARTNKNMSSIASNMIGPLAQGFNVLFDAGEKGASKWALAMSFLPKGFAGIGIGADGLATILDHLNQQMDKGKTDANTFVGPLNQVAAALTAQGQAAKFMQALETDAAATLTAAQLENLGHLKDIGALNAKNAAGIGVNAVEFAAYGAAVERAMKTEAELFKLETERANKQAAALAANTKLADAATAQLVANSGTATDAQIANAKKVSDDDIAQRIKAGTADATFYKNRAALDKATNDAIITDHARVAVGSIEALTQEATKQQATLTEMLTGRLHYSRAAIDAQIAVRDAAVAAARGEETAVENVSTAFDDWNDSIMGVNRALDGTTLNTKELVAAQQKLHDMGSTKTLDLDTAQGRAQVAIDDPLVAYYLHEGYSLAQAYALQLGKQWNFPVNIATPGPRVPGFAGGVDNFGGGLAVVGERGPELVSLPSGSSVFPSGTGGGTSVSVGLQVSGLLDPRTIRTLTKAVKTEILDAMARRGPLPRR